MKDYTKGLSEDEVRAELNRIKNAAAAYKYEHRWSTAGRWVRIKQALYQNCAMEMMDIMMEEMEDLVFGCNYFKNPVGIVYTQEPIDVTA